MPEDQAFKSGSSGHGGGQGHSAPFDFNQALLHHNMPYPAWEISHGKPLLVFNLGQYAAINYAELRQDPACNAVDGRPYLSWAQAVKASPDFRYDAGQLRAADLSRCMALVARDRAGGVFPRWLGFFNHQTFFGLVALVIVTVFLAITCRRRPGQVAPASRVQLALEGLVEYLRDQMVRPLIPSHPDRWAPFLISMFIVILAVNLFGMIPGGATMSGNIGVTAGFATVTLMTMLIAGMVEQGPVTYWVRLVPIPFTWAMSPIWLMLLAIELLGLAIKPVALAIRLFANMFSGHTTLLVLLSLGYMIIAQSPKDVPIAGAMGVLGVVFAALISLIELLVAFVQAYVFTMLSAMFIGMSVHPEH